MASIKEENIPKTTAEQVGETITVAVESRTQKIEKPKKFIYVGPPTKTLLKYSIFEGGIPTFAEEHFEKCPALKKLFINPSELTNFQLQFADTNSVEAMFYKKAEEYFSEVK